MPLAGQCWHGDRAVLGSLEVLQPLQDACPGSWREHLPLAGLGRGLGSCLLLSSVFPTRNDPAPGERGCAGLMEQGSDISSPSPYSTSELRLPISRCREEQLCQGVRSSVGGGIQQGNTPGPWGLLKVSWWSHSPAVCVQIGADESWVRKMLDEEGVG